MTQSFLLTIYATYGILFTVPTEYPTYEQCLSWRTDNGRTHEIEKPT